MKKYGFVFAAVALILRYIHFRGGSSDWDWIMLFSAFTGVISLILFTIGYNDTSLESVGDFYQFNFVLIVVHFFNYVVFATIALLMQDVWHGAVSIFSYAIIVILPVIYSIFTVKPYGRFLEFKRNGRNVRVDRLKVTNYQFTAVSALTALLSKVVVPLDEASEINYVTVFGTAMNDIIIFMLLGLTLALSINTLIDMVHSAKVV